MEKSEPSYTAGGNGNIAPTLENSLAVLQRLSNRMQQFHSKVHTQETQKHMSSRFIETFLITEKKKKKKKEQPKCPPTDGWINKLWYAHTMEHNSYTNEILIHAKVWMILE